MNNLLAVSAFATVSILLIGIGVIPGISAEDTAIDVATAPLQTQSMAATTSADDDFLDRIPKWVKSNAGWWANDLIDDDTFVSGIQFLIEEELILVSSLYSDETLDAENKTIPKWIKSNADWWSQGIISDDDFLKGVEFLVESGIIHVDVSMLEPQLLDIGGIDLSQASPVLGDEDADITIVEFGDYQCPNCKKWFLNTKPDIVENYIETGIANLYFVDLAFLGDDSLPASAATYCAEEQGLYWEYHSHLYSNQRRIDSGWANLSSLHTYAEVLGLDKDVFSSCMESGKYDESVVFNLEEGINNGVKGTPSFIVVGPNGEKKFIEGPQPFVVFESVIESMIKS